MRIKSILAVGLVSAALAGCTSLTRSDTNAWLESRASATQESIAGKWTTTGGAGPNWGEANFIQDGAMFYGTLGMYNVDGAVNGDQIYLALSSGKTVYYTVRLRKQPDGTYAGRAVADAIIGDAGRADGDFTVMTLRRLGR
jgi:hypothetical protein